MTKKRKVNPDNLPYRGEKKSRSGTGSALDIRATHGNTFVDEKGKTQEVINTVVVEEGLFSDFSPKRQKKAKRETHEVVKAVPTHAPTSSPSKNDPSNSSPLKATLFVNHSPSANRVSVTPRRRIVRKIAKVGVEGKRLHFYTNVPAAKKVPHQGKLYKPAVDKDSITDPEKITALKKIPPPTGTKKRMEVYIDKKSVEQAKKSRKASRNQSKFFNMGANAHAEALQECCFELHFIGKVRNTQCEILHAVAYRFLGQKAQKLDNLFLQTVGMNTWMIPNEDFIDWLTKRYPDDRFKLIVEAPLKPKMIDNKMQYTHFSEGEIIYRLTSRKGLKLDLDLTLLEDSIFHKEMAKFWDIFKVKITNQHEKNNDINNILYPSKP